MNLTVTPYKTDPVQCQVWFVKVTVQLSPTKNPTQASKFSGSKIDGQQYVLEDTWHRNIIQDGQQKAQWD